jgi:predicted NodU family carbamoyl transferase
LTRGTNRTASRERERPEPPVERETGLPVVLNTSFNENEPIVETAGEALQCFLRTRMDLLVLGNYMVRRG